MSAFQGPTGGFVLNKICYNSFRICQYVQNTALNVENHQTCKFFAKTINLTPFHGLKFEEDNILVRYY